MSGSGQRSGVTLAAVAALGIGLVCGALVMAVIGRGGAAPEAALGPVPGAGDAGAGGGAAQMVPPAAVRVGAVVRERVQERFSVVGRLQEVQRAIVASEVKGKVVSAPVEEGDRVEKGKTVLAKIDPVWATSELEASVARVASAEATLEQSKLDLRYLEDLARANSAKPKEVEDARAQVKANQAALDAAIAERDLAQYSVDRLEVLAPFDGVVVSEEIEVGQWVEPGDPVVEMISTGGIDAVVYVPERLVNGIAVGQAIEVVIEPLGRSVEGEVVAIIPSGMSQARTFPVKVRLSDEGGVLKAGMSATAQMPVGEASERLTVPRDAVLFSGGKATVWAAITGQGSGEGAPAMPQAMPVGVSVLFGTGGRYAVEPLAGPGGAGLSAETPVVIEGAEKLFPTQPLIIVGSSGSEGGARVSVR